MEPSTYMSIHANSEVRARREIGRRDRELARRPASVSWSNVKGRRIILPATGHSIRGRFESVMVSNINWRSILLTWSKTTNARALSVFIYNEQVKWGFLVRIRSVIWSLVFLKDYTCVELWKTTLSWTLFQEVKYRNSPRRIWIYSKKFYRIGVSQWVIGSFINV